MLGIYKTENSRVSGIPIYIENSERIVRILYFPKHVYKNEKSVKWGAFRSPAGKDEVSVIRLDYCSPEFCKNQGKEHQNPEQKRSYFGLAVLIAKEIREVEAEVIYTPEGNHIYHADIKVGFIYELGKEPPAKIKYKVETMAQTARIYKDPNPDSNIWEGLHLE